MAIKKWLKAQSRGSLIPLSFGFFLLAMSLSFISINIASAYSVKKELTNVAESAINKSAQSINTLAYYAQQGPRCASHLNEFQCLGDVIDGVRADGIWPPCDVVQFSSRLVNGVRDCHQRFMVQRDASQCRARLVQQPLQCAEGGTPQGLQPTRTDSR